MRKKIVAAVFSLLSTACSANDADDQPRAIYDKSDAEYDAQQIWLSGCSDFKSGMNEGDFVKWLRLEDQVKAIPQIRRTAVVRLYMDGWDTARAMKGIVSCKDFAQRRASDYASGIDIRQP